VRDLSNCLAQFGGGRRASRGGAKRDSPGQRRANFNNLNKGCYKAVSFEFEFRR
jgi:hypothetical protein